MKEIDWSKAPEGATHYQTEADIWYKQTHDAYQWDCGQWIKLARSDLGEYALRGIVELPAPVEWAGTGLPPVGTVCEVFNQELHAAAWERCEILFAGRHRVVYDSESCSERVGDVEYLKFRPIRTPEQIAAEEREKQLEAMEEVAARAWHSVAPGEDMISVIVAALHADGYRKTEAP